MSEIYAPGSIAGPQGPAGPAGSQGSVTALAGSVLPAPGNLFDLNKVTANYTLNADGSLSASTNWNTTGLIFCPGATSMVSNMPITLFNASMVLYDANGNVTGTVTDVALGAAYSANFNKMNINAAFPLPGTQVYVRFAYVPPWYGNGYAANDAAAMVYASTSGTASLPASYTAFGYDTPTSVNAKIAASMRDVGSAMEVFAQNVLPAPCGANRNAFDYTKVIPNVVVGPAGVLTPNAGFATAMVFCPGATSATTNIPIWVYPDNVCVCAFDVNGNFLADLTPGLVAHTGNGSAPDAHLIPITAFPLPGTQTYLMFSYNGSWNSYQYGSSPQTGVFYAGTAANPPQSAYVYEPFSGNVPVSVKTASQLGCVPDQSQDATPKLNAFLATASAANPVKLILDGMFNVSGLVIAPAGYTTIEGIGWGSGIFVAPGSNQDAIRIGAYTAATGCSEGEYDIAAPARTAINITLRDFTINANGGANTTGGSTGLAPANAPVAGAAAHTCYGTILANCANVLVDHVNYLNPPAYNLCLTNVNNVVVRGCSFASGGVLQDGVHIDGPSSDIVITDSSFATGDDAIALNAPEGYGGDISRVVVANCRFLNSLTLIRIYTSLTTATLPSNNVHKVRNVIVTGCVGSTQNAPFNLGIQGNPLPAATTDPDQLQDITIANCSLTSSQGLVGCFTPIGALSLRGVSYIPTGTAALVKADYAIEELLMDDVKVLRNADGNGAPSSFVMVANGVTVGRATLIECRVMDETGTSYAPLPSLVDVQGTLSNLRLESMDMAQIAALTSGAGWAGITTLRGAGVLGSGAQVPDSVMDAGTLYLSSNAGGTPSIKVGGTAKRLTLA